MVPSFAVSAGASAFATQVWKVAALAPAGGVPGDDAAAFETPRSDPAAIACAAGEDAGGGGADCAGDGMKRSR